MTESIPTPEPTPADPEDFDLDAWIDGVHRATAQVALFNPLPAEEKLRFTALEAAYADAEDRLAKARRAEERGVERSITDAGPEQLEQEVADAAQAVLDFRAGLEKKALHVVVTEVTPDERLAAERRAVEEKFADGIGTGALGWGWLYWAAEHTTTKSGRTFTPQQLLRLARRDNSGWSQVRQLRDAIDRISVAPTVPSSPGSSTSPAGRTSSAS